MNRTPRRLTATGALFLFLLAALPFGETVCGEDWPHWRGPQRNDHTTEPSGWVEGEWKLGDVLWERSLGAGSSSPLVVGGKLYSLSHGGGNEYVVALDAATGRELWSQSYRAPEYGRHSTGDKGLYSGPSGTPEFDSSTGLLYTLGSDGDLACWDTAAEGREVWRKNLHAEYRIPQRPQVGRSGLRDYGYTTAPLVHGDWLLVEVGAEQGNLIAFEKRTGKEVWRSDAADPPGHCGGMAPMNVDGMACLAVFTFDHLRVYRLEGERPGTTLGAYPWKTEFAKSIASPAVHENSVIITAGYNYDKIIRLDASREGLRQVWEQPFHSKVCSPVIHKGYVYWGWEDLYCLDFQTGELVWRLRAGLSDPGSLILTADERLIAWGASGRLFLAETTPRAAKGKILVERNLPARSDAWPHAVLAAGRLYCKDRSGTIRCLAIGDAAP